MACPESLAALKNIETASLNTAAATSNLASMSTNITTMKSALDVLVTNLPQTPIIPLAEIQAIKTSLANLEIALAKPENVDLPSNTFNKIPEGWTEDIVRFTVGDGAATVAATDVTKQLTEMHSGMYWIVKEVRYYASGTAIADATHSIKDTETGTTFAQGYYHEGSFSILSGNRNGVIGRPLRQKPTITLNSGTGAAAQKWYGSVKYYFR